MHLLQWMHSDVSDVPARMRFGQVGLAEQGTGHGDEGEPLGEGHLHGRQLA